MTSIHFLVETKNHLCYRAGQQDARQLTGSLQLQMLKVTVKPISKLIQGKLVCSYFCGGAYDLDGWISLHLCGVLWHHCIARQWDSCLSCRK